MDFCDGWMPRGNYMADPSSVMETLQRYADEAGRDMGSIAVSVFRAPPKADYLAQCQEAGVMRVVLQLPSAGEDVVMPLLDEYAALQSI